MRKIQSHAIKANGLVFASGQIPCTADGQILTEGSIGEKTALVIQNVKAVLEAAGTSLDKVVKVTVCFVLALGVVNGLGTDDI